jgi:hypothetical protein
MYRVSYSTHYFSTNPTERSQVLLGPANKVAILHCQKRNYYSLTDGLSVFILKDVGCIYLSGPNSTPNSGFLVLKGHW